jgi:dGTPase
MPRDSQADPICSRRQIGRPDRRSDKVPFYHSGDFGRMVDIPDPGIAEPYRSPFRRDFARVVHTPAFRRLQRKTQLFPGDESDFFRNRMSHSLEVAQIAKSIALRLNYLVNQQYGNRHGTIDTDLVELVSLAHDLGHPPFGHTGEYALHEKMHRCGGFEGNAQTLRILTRLEKRQTIPEGSSPSDFIEFSNEGDLRAGLNLCYRSLAGVLKYDHEIPRISADSSLSKGYYASESGLVVKIKRSVLADRYEEYIDKPFRVIEMQIMDLADDITYSTYDFEDALKAGFASPLDIFQQLNSNAEVRDAVARKLFKNAHGRSFPDKYPAEQDIVAFEEIRTKMLVSVFQMLKKYFIEVDQSLSDDERSRLADQNPSNRASALSILAINFQKLSEEISRNGYVRAQFTSDLVGRRIRSVGIQVNEDVPALSQLTIPDDVRFEIDVLKHLTYELHIKSPRLKLIEYRGKQIVHELFDCFDKDAIGELLPYDWRERLQKIQTIHDGEEMRKRLICDYIAGMTDSYALDVYSRLKTTNPSALFRPT